MANVSKKSRDARLIWLGSLQGAPKDRGRCSNENMEVTGHRKIGRPTLR